MRGRRCKLNVYGAGESLGLPNREQQKEPDKLTAWPNVQGERDEPRDADLERE